MTAILLRILLWPLRQASAFLFPQGEFDGLSPAVTEKAAQYFVNYLKSLATTPTQQAYIDEAFSKLGFAALRQEAVSSNSLVVVYLHSPLNRQATSFCNTLTQNSMLEFLNQDHIKTLGTSIQTSQGASLSHQLGAACIPLLAMLQPGRGASDGMKLIFKAEGPALMKMQPAQLISLMSLNYHHHLALVTEVEARRIEREQEINLRREQDAEYQAALLADQERERQRQEEREREERRTQEEEERERKEVEDEQKRLHDATLLLRPEPASGGTRIRFTLPSGQKLDRRFENSETIGALRAYLILHFAEKDPEIRNIGLSTNFPKQTHNDDSKSLVESCLCPQSVLMVQDLDA
jgi:FAS-associated factor 2